MTDKNWSLTPLSEVLVERTEKPDLEDILLGRIRIISKINFGDGQIQLRNESKTKTGMIIIKPGDLVLSGINATKGAIALYDSNAKDSIAATIHYGAYIPNKDKVETKYLWLLLRSEVFKNILNEYLPGGIKTELKAKRFLKIPIPLPPLLEQQRIVTKIDELKNLIEEAKKLRRLSTEETESFIYSTLKEIIEKGIKKGWNIIPFSTACEINPSKRGTSYSDDLQVSFIPMESVNAQSGKITHPFVRLYQEVSKGYTWFIEGDVIFARIIPCMENGKSAIAKNLKNGVGFGSTEFHVLRPKEGVLAEWIHYLVRRPSFRDLAAANFKGTAGQQRVPELFFYNQKIPLPPIEEQNNIIAYLDNLQSKINNLKLLQVQTQSELDALIPSILSKAFKGELTN